MSDDLLKVRDLAPMLGLSESSVLDRFEAGDLPGFRLFGKKGGPIRFRRSEIEALLESWRVGTIPGDPKEEARRRDDDPGRGTGGTSPDATTKLQPVS